MKKNSAISPTFTIIGVVVIIGIIAVAAIAFRPSQSPQVQGAQTGTTQLISQKSEVNSEFDIKALNVQGVEAKSTIAMNIKDADKTNEILIKGNPATAKGDSRFLVLNVELSNTSTERLIVAPLDLIRLVVDNQKRAAEIYSEEVASIRGSVIVEPDSTKVTRIGFVLTEDIVSKPISLQVGEVDAEEKSIVELTI